ncbi:hypothetical protein [Blastococcus sp. SYSU DS0617]
MLTIMVPVDPTVDLRRFDVFPFPLATGVHWTDKGFEIDLMVVTDVHDSGYSSMPIASHTVAYSSGRPPETPAELEAALREAWVAFARRLARALGE